MSDLLRYELKFVVPRWEESRLEAWLRTHPEGFSRAFPPRRVTSLYFDDPGLGSVEDNLAGASRRTKVRLRWYGEGDAPRPGRLEVKGRQAGLGWKRGYPVEDLPPQGSWSELDGQLRAALPEEAAPWWREAPQPTLVTRYERRYLLSADGRLRLTVDAGLEAFDQRFSRRLDWSRAAPTHDVLVVEVKCAAEDQALLVEAVRRVPGRRTRHSKYVGGVLGVLG